MPAVAEYDSVVLRHRPLGAAALEQMVAPPQVFLVRLPDNLVVLWMLVMEADAPPHVLVVWLAVAGSLVAWWWWFQRWWTLCWLAGRCWLCLLGWCR